MRKKTLILVALVVSLLPILSPLSVFANEKSEIEQKLFDELTEPQLEYYEKFKENGGSIEFMTKQEKEMVLSSEQQNEIVSDFKGEIADDFKKQ